MCGWRWLLIGAILAGGCDRHARKPVPAPARDAAVAKPTPPDPLRGWYHWIDPRKEYSVWFPREPTYIDSFMSDPLPDDQKYVGLLAPGAERPYLGFFVSPDDAGSRLSLDAWREHFLQGRTGRHTVSRIRRRNVEGWEVREADDSNYRVMRLLRNRRSRSFVVGAAVIGEFADGGLPDPAAFPKLTTFLDSFELQDGP